MEVQLKFCYNTFTNLLHGRVRKFYELQESYYLKACKYVLLELISHYEITSAQNEDFKSVLSNLYLKLSSVQLELASLAKNKDGLVQLSFLQSLILLKASYVGKTASKDLLSIGKNILKFAHAERQDENLNEVANTVQVQLITMVKSFKANLSNLSKLGEIANVDSLFALHKAKKLEYTSIITTGLEKCIEILGRPPCQYALVGRRLKIASKLIIPYSDLQNLFVLENPEVKGDRQLIKTYFKNLSLIFHVVLCLGDAVVLPKTFVTRVLNDLLEGQVYNYLPLQFLKPTMQLDMFADKLNLPPPMLTFENFKNHSPLNYQNNEPAINKDVDFLSGDEALFTKLQARQEQTLPLKDEIKDDWNAITSLTSRKYRRSVKNVDSNYLMLSRARRCKAAVDQICEISTIDDNIASCLEFISLVAVNVRLKMDSYLFVGSNESVPSFVEIVGTENAVQYFKCILTIYDLVLEQNDKSWKNVFQPLAYYELGLFEEAIAGCKQLSENCDDGDDLWLKNIVFYSLVHLRNPKAVDFLLDMHLEKPFVNLLDALLVYRDFQLNFESIWEEEQAEKIFKKENEILQHVKSLHKDNGSRQSIYLLWEACFDQILQFEKALRFFEATGILTGALLNIDVPQDYGISCLKYKFLSDYKKKAHTLCLNLMFCLLDDLNEFPNRFSLSIAIGYFALAKACFALHFYVDALTYFDEARRIWQINGFVKRTVLCYRMQGLVAYTNAEYSRSMELYRKAIAIESTKINREKGTLHEATVFTTMAHCCHMLGDIYEMEVYTNKVKEINSINYGSEFVLLTVSCQMLIGRSFYEELEFEVAQKFYEDSIDTIFDLPDFKDHQPFYYFNKWRLGCCLCRQSMFSEALNLFELSLRSNMFVSRTQSTVALWCGTCLNRMQCYHEAVQYLEESYVIRTTMLSEDLMTDPYAVDYFTTHGFATSRIGSYKESLESYDKLKTILLQRQVKHPDAGYEVRIASCQFHSAGVYYRQGNYKKARELTLLYLGILKREENIDENQKDENNIFIHGYSKEIAFCHKLLGQCYYAESQFAKAAKEFKCEMNICERITEKAIMDNGLAWCKFNLGKCYFGLRQHRLAAEQFEVAIEIWKYCDVNHLKSKRKIITCGWWLEKATSVANRPDFQ